MDAAAGIEVTGVRRAFGSVLAVDHIDLQARPGEVTALVGPNGAGKTTLLLMLATLLAPDAGSIRIGGLDPFATPGEVRAAMGWMPDGFGTWDALTVREVLETVAAAYRMAPGAARTRAAELLDLVHLGDLADRPARVLSRGQKQRLGLARALVHSPSICCWTNLRPDSTRAAGSSCGTSSAAWRRPVRPCLSPATSSPSFRRSLTAPSSSPEVGASRCRTSAPTQAPAPDPITGSRAGGSPR